MPCVKHSYDRITKQIVIPVFLASKVSIKESVDVDRNKKVDVHMEDRAQCSALVDTGATNSCIGSDLAEKMELQPDGLIEVRGVHGKKPSKLYTVGLAIPDIGFVLPGLSVCEIDTTGSSYDVLLGMDILTRGVLTMDFGGNFVFCI